ncbi:MAG TPA: isochorismatase family cysteine hydrolase [Chloroflexota bacterium]|nr:isochorismatase family cysteine hydrolase [Chloroflexota bacterium]
MTEALTTLRDLVYPPLTALVVVDMQNDFCDSRHFPMAEPMLPRLVRFTAAARAAGLPIIRFRMLNTPQTSSAVWTSHLGEGPIQHQICVPGTPGAEFHPDFQPAPGDIVITKPRYSGFIGTNFETILRTLGVRALICTGIATNVCVESLARDAFQRDYYTIVVSDCTATRSQAEHEASLHILRRRFGVVATADEIIACWQDAAVTAHGAP